MVHARTLIAAAAAVIGAFALSPAMANPVGSTTTWQLNGTGASTNNCPTVSTFGADCGSVTATQVATGTSAELSISVDLSPNTVFASTGGPHNTFAFALTVDLPSSDFTIPTGWTLNSMGVTGGEEYVLSCNTKGATTNACGTGTSPPNVTSLVLDITAANLSLSDFINTADNTPIEADVGSGPNCIANPAKGQTSVCTTGEVFSNTTVTTNGNPTPIPEPLTISLFGAGLAGLGALRRRKAK